MKSTIHTIGRKCLFPISPSRGWVGRFSGALLMLVLGGSLVSAQDDLPYDSGSTEADGALDITPHPWYVRDARASFDAAREEVVLFGGYWSSTFRTETWTFDVNTQRWTNESPDTFVSGRHSQVMEYDPIGQRVLLFGGSRADNTLLNDMWSWDGTDWTELTPANAPTPRADSAAAINPATGEIILFGGQDSSGYREDTWSWDGTTWTEVTTDTVPDIAYSYYTAMAFDSGEGVWVLYDSWNRETWIFDGTDWTYVSSGVTPSCGHGFPMVYDPVRDEVVLSDGDHRYNETWVWKDHEWSLKSPANKPNRRYEQAMVYDSVNEVIYTINGLQDNVWDARLNGNYPNYNTYAWDGTTWSYVCGHDYVFDMTDRADGVWNFTSISIPVSVQVTFTKNSTNTPVTWLASGPVDISGGILLDGENAPDNTGSGDFAEGGPGGGAGGIGAIRYDVSGSYAGTPGQGPGGGAPGVAQDEYGADGRYRDTYGNSLLQPLQGGSGGGGGGSDGDTHGGNGGGGGGAIMIASSRDITINGAINADGGDNRWSGETYGGEGSGGAIRLVADRVLGSGDLSARGGRSYTDGRGGRIRIEAYYRPLAANSSPTPSATAPVIDLLSGDTPALAIVSIDGADVSEPPTGDPRTPDVIFADENPVTIVVMGTNLPEGTPVTVRVSASGGIINLPGSGEDPVTLDGTGMASFTATIPAGVGTVQAFAEYEQ